jgi:hypothetical protein
LLLLLLVQSPGSWLHIVNWQGPGVQLASVLLVCEDCWRDSASIPQTPAGVAAVADKWPRLASGGGVAVGNVNNATAPSWLEAVGDKETLAPALLYINANISLQPSRFANGNVDILRPLTLLGLSSVNTSVDFQMGVNQLDLTSSPRGSVNFTSLVLENNGYGDTQSSQYAAPFSVQGILNVWAVQFDR